VIGNFGEVLSSLGVERRFLKTIAPKDIDCACHGADLVAPVPEGYGQVEIAFGNGLHGVRQQRYRAGQQARKAEGKKPEDHQRQTTNAKEDEHRAPQYRFDGTAIDRNHHGAEDSAIRARNGLEAADIVDALKRPGLFEYSLRKQGAMRGGASDKSIVEQPLPLRIDEARRADGEVG
jgi:hypothetical protein